MAHGFAQGYNRRISVLVFLKGLVSPIVLYVENPQETYLELLDVLRIQSSIPKVIEKETLGPIKRVSFLTNQIAAVAIQEEPVA